MLSSDEKQILEQLKETNPDAYQLFLNLEEKHFTNIKYGCHELRNMVTLISGAYQLLNLTQPQLASVSRWKQMGDDIKGLVRAFDDISVLRYSHKLTPAKIPLSNLTSNIKEYIRSNYPDKAYHISFDSSCECELNTDISHLSTAVCRLIDNAIEAADFNNVSSLPVRIKIHNEGAYLKIAVSNIGAGPSENMKSCMYDPFKSDKTGHLGLGLSIVNETADAMNGTITYSQHEALCTFELSIPCAAEN